MTLSERIERAGSFRIFKGDACVWAIYFFLCAISLIEVYSSASTLSYATGAFWRPIIMHALFLAIGLLIVIIAHNIPSSWFKVYPIIFGGLSLILLAILLLMGAFTNGARRWLEIPIIGMNFQPSEMAKGAVVIGVALLLSVYQEEKGASRQVFKYILLGTFVFCALIVSENLSTAGILFIVVLLQMFLGRVPFSQLGSLLGILALALALAFAVMMVLPDSTLEQTGLHRLTTWKARITRFIGEGTKQVTPEDFDIDKEAQTAHSHIAVTQGGLIGKGPGNSVRRDFLSHAYSDFIYAIIIEEMGLIGGTLVAFLYLWLLMRAESIAWRCERNFPAFLVLGLALLMVVQALVNMAVAVGAIPITGQTLPLVSRGGTSMLFNSLYIGMILSVSRFAKRRTATADRARQAVSQIKAQEPQDE